MCMASAHLRLAVADCIRDPSPPKRTLDATLSRLWREPSETVTQVHRAMLAGQDAMAGDGAYLSGPDIGSRNGILAGRMRDLRRPLPRRDRPGLQLQDIAADLFIDRETLARLMERHDLLELVPYGRLQSRRLVTDRALRAGLGHNADPGGARSVRLDGHARAAVFPVFYPEALPVIIKLLGWDGIRADAAAVSGKRARLEWALENHADLPDQAIADLAGCSFGGVRKGRERVRSRGRKKVWRPRRQSEGGSLALRRNLGQSPYVPTKAFPHSLERS